MNGAALAEWGGGGVCKGALGSHLAHLFVEDVTQVGDVLEDGDVAGDAAVGRNGAWGGGGRGGVQPLTPILGEGVNGGGEKGMNGGCLGQRCIPLG